MAFLPAIAAVASIGAAALGGISAYQEKKAGEATANYNAKASDIAGAAERDAAGAEAEDRARKLSGQRATSLAARGASGVNLAGTPLTIDENMLGEMELDVARVKSRGEAKANQYENQGTLDRMTAANYRRAAPISAGAAALSAGSSLLGRQKPVTY